MAFRQAKVYAYDCLDQVVVTVRLQETADCQCCNQEWTTVVQTAIQGTGEPDRRAWLQDALIAALEAL